PEPSIPSKVINIINSYNLIQNTHSIKIKQSCTYHLIIYFKKLEH
ncbi:hypothetical protein EHRUM3_10350, partial [Ehrlichia ruminantium]